MKKKMTIWTFMLLMAASLYILGGLRPDVSAHEGSHEAEEGEAGEGGGIAAYLDGRLLPTPGSLSSDLAELRISPQDVADALDLPYRWDMGTRTVYIDEKPLPAEADPVKIGANVMAVAEPLAKSLGLNYRYDDAGHMVMLGTPKAEKLFQEQEAKVRDVFEGRGLTPTVDADGTKTFTLTAEMSDWAPVKGVLTTAWTYNGQVAGPTIRVTEGDKVRIKFVNKLPEPSTIHWHGFHLPNAMDGVPGITQQAVEPGKEFVYEFTASHPGTFMYHSHYDDMKQIVGGLYGAFIIDPAAKPVPVPATGELSDGMAFDRDYTMVLSRMNVNAGLDDEPDYFTINGRSYPDTPPIELKKGQTARVRLINIDPVEVHTMHLHGMDFQVIARNGHAVKTPETMNTVLLGPGETVDLAFRADAPGDWMFHCHILDHTMNGGEHARMGAEMGGLITLVKVAS
ncbi:multicopper oxidase domain-containing protein [Cohnella sp. CFH 77786]|uniref:multicopper oxidase family protein n=1 Tax=Cohnella sp. CFH 77786 TaxID=2662265 RepID=UPI001C60ADFC|nr:multicopper oxidase domain-containing protein [Cohnella sp. CFH 77786]MBW5445716.1 multicopper oxidase domain-containing protein [Cohnella sp. CFH 77786]